jgi:hypothetical protein
VWWESSLAVEILQSLATNAQSIMMLHSAGLYPSSTKKNDDVSKEADISSYNMNTSAVYLFSLTLVQECIIVIIFHV